ncbi:MAG TPA: carboxypeptidase-like regulatory domain-containing protein [Candidatus Baltobacteraceae bacterium]|nr:carboxypeptidase-like regulatory domain-containing protein [Candidatus Baltobacteraceae bacterium]
MKRLSARMGPTVPVALFIILGIVLLPFSSARAQQPLPQAASGPANPAQDQAKPSGIISGTIVDRTGAGVAGARVKLTAADHSSPQEKTADSSGGFFFANITPGPFELSISAQGFATQTYEGTLQGGEALTVPPIAMALASVITEVHVSPEEEAKVELKAEEKQRVLGVIPNFYVSYVPDAAPLSAKQKFQLALKTTIDPVTFVLNAGTAGFEQATDYYSGYGQGAQGYAKRYGASYADTVLGNFIGGAILPSLLKQDPRYFYKGTGSTRSRVLYSLVNAVICKGDNGRWQANYSNIAGSFIASGIANVYYPASDRGGATTVESALIGIGASGAGDFIEEFVVPRLTSIPHPGASKPPHGSGDKPGI